MGIAINTAGVLVGYAVEETAGTRPEANYTLIGDIKSVPELNPAPSSQDTTDLSQTEYKTYIEGLKDLGGALEFGANFTESLLSEWETLVSAYKTGIASSKETWFEVYHPKLTKAVFFKGIPSSQGLPAMEVDSVLETTLYVTPSGAPEWQDAVKPTKV